MILLQRDACVRYFKFYREIKLFKHTWCWIEDPYWEYNENICVKSVIIISGLEAGIELRAKVLVFPYILQPVRENHIDF